MQLTFPDRAAAKLALTALTAHAVALTRLSSAAHDAGAMADYIELLSERRAALRLAASIQQLLDAPPASSSAAPP